MKKFICLLVVFALTAPLFGAKVDIVVTHVGGGKVQIGYANDGLPGAEMPVGLALTVDAGGDDITGLVSQDPCQFLVYLDYASDDPCNYNISDGHPLAASETAPGALTVPGDFPVSKLVVCMGRLDPCLPGPNPGPDAVVNLVTLQLADGADSDPCWPLISVMVSANTYRGSVVGNASPVPTNLPQGIIVPVCWLGTTQCHGDHDNSGGQMDTSDFYPFKDAWVTTYAGNTMGTAVGEYNPCTDSDQDGTIATPDFYEFKDYWGQTPPTDCPAGRVAGGNGAVVGTGLPLP